MEILNTPSHQSNYSEEILSNYSPRSAADCFHEALLVSVHSTNLFRVYINHPNTSTHPIVYVFHHGAGYSGLSAACLASQIRSQSNAQFGFLSFDCRGHGSSKVGLENPPPPDLSLSTLSNDLVELLSTIYPDKNQAPSFILVGHSMGGAVVTEACANIQAQVGNVIGLVILDVVEGSALSSLKSMMPLIDSRPSSFNSPAECIKYHLDSHTLRNIASARVSVPSLIRKTSPNPIVPDQSHPLKSETSGTTLTHQRYEWITDLRASEPYWEGWYSGLSKKFLAQKTARLLILAGTDRLDKELTIGQMQGKYQLSVLPHVGHCIHEDDPIKLADLLITFARRNDQSTSDQILARLGKKLIQKK